MIYSNDYLFYLSRGMHVLALALAGNSMYEAVANIAMLESGEKRRGKLSDKEIKELKALANEIIDDLEKMGMEYEAKENPDYAVATYTKSIKNSFKILKSGTFPTELEEEKEKIFRLVRDYYKTHDFSKKD